MTKAINIIFDGPPSHKSGRFVEIETDDGKSINVGEWIDQGNGFWALRITKLPKENEEADKNKYREGYEIGFEHGSNREALIGGMMKWSDDKTLRYWLWLKHGHTGIYGDDGEMQCSECGLDFKRDPVERIDNVFTRQAQEAAFALLAVEED